MLKTEKQKIVTAIGIAVLLLAGFAMIRPDDKHGVPLDAFWTQKLNSNETYELVAAGDSRILHSLDMAKFEDAGFGRGLNFGFRGSASSIKYLSAAESRLATDGAKILAIGFTPNGFTPNAMATNGFLEKQETYKEKRFEMPIWFSKFQQRLRPVQLGEIARLLKGTRNPLQETYHENGWVEAKHANPNIERALRFYKVRFDQNQVEQKYITAACEYVEEAVARGCHVFGFKPPISEAMSELENSKSGFEYDAFILKFEQAGGIWIEVDSSRFATHDGSHLESKSATEFSSWLATQIKTKLSPSN